MHISAFCNTFLVTIRKSILHKVKVANKIYKAEIKTRVTRNTTPGVMEADFHVINLALLIIYLNYESQCSAYLNKLLNAI